MFTTGATATGGASDGSDVTVGALPDAAWEPLDARSAPDPEPLLAQPDGDDPDGVPGALLTPLLVPF